jgi:hypothetical protein
MALKELLVQRNQAEGVDSRLRLAMNLATRHACRLIALFVEEWNEAQMGADLSVTGAYTHSRLKERLFGGVTRSLLEGTRFPLLMSH